LADQKAQKEIEKLDAEIAKIQAEKSKINAEVRAGREPFYRTSAFYLAFSPVVLAVFGLLFTQLSGWFDVQKQKIENEKILLTFDTKKLEEQKAKLTADTQSLESEKQQQRSELERYKSEVQNLQMEYSQVATNLQTLRIAGTLYNELRSLIKPLKIPHGGIGIVPLTNQAAMQRLIETNYLIVQKASEYIRAQFPEATNHNQLAWEVISEEWPGINAITYYVIFDSNLNYSTTDCVKFMLGLTNVPYLTRADPEKPK